ncbi:MAG: hypothetical protein ACKVXR_01175 [Planctomycetota bacterium]
MTFTCTAVRDMLLECRGHTGSNDPSLAVHLDECPECSEFARRTKALVAHLSALPRRPAPAELAGLVVAATQAGHRQERAANAVSALSRLPVPSDLEIVAFDEERVDEQRSRLDPIGARAPAVLDRLVDEELRDPAAAISRRFASRLDRRRAPGALRERVAGTVRAFLPPSRLRLILPLAAGVALLVLVGVRFFGERSSQVGEATDGFQVVYESTMGSMDPMARGLLAGLTGGVVDVHASSGLQTDGGAR